MRVGNAIGEDMECGQPALGDLFWSALDSEKQVPDPCRGESFPSEYLKPPSRVLSNLGELRGPLSPDFTKSSAVLYANET